jgi:hypothetical protein
MNFFAGNNENIIELSASLFDSGFIRCIKENIDDYYREFSD